MKKLLYPTCVLAVVAGLLGASSLAAESPAGVVNFGKFTKPTNGELVEINLNGVTIAMATQLVGKGQPELAEALGGLHSLRVNVIGLDDQNREEIVARVKAVRGQLEGAGWQKIVSVQEKKEDVSIFLKSRGKEAIEGVVVTVLDGRKEAVLINVAGDLRIDKLAAVAEKFNLGALKQAAEALLKQATTPREAPAPKK